MDNQWREKVLDIVRQDRVAICGVVGAVGVRGLAWWTAQGFGACDENRFRIAYPLRAGDVDSVDGLLMVLSPWAVRSLRFDEERFSGFHGYDADLCFQARAQGQRVVVRDIRVWHHTRGGYGDLAAYVRADEHFRSKWGLPTRNPVITEQPRLSGSKWKACLRRLERCAAWAVATWRASRRANGR